MARTMRGMNQKQQNPSDHQYPFYSDTRNCVYLDSGSVCVFVWVALDSML